MLFSESFLMRSIIPYRSTNCQPDIFSVLDGLDMKSDLWHNWRSVLILYVAEGHLGTLMLVHFNFRVVNEWYLVEWNCDAEISLWSV